MIQVTINIGESLMTNIHTREEIKQVETKELVDLYNKISGKSIKKFSSRAAGENQTWKLIQAKQVPVEEVRKPATEKKSAPKKRETYECKIIKILKEENEKRPSSRAFDKFAILLKMDGKTIRDFKAQEGKHVKLDIEEGWPATELRWALKLGLAKLVNPQ